MGFKFAQLFVFLWQNKFRQFDNSCGEDVHYVIYLNVHYYIVINIILYPSQNSRNTTFRVPIQLNFTFFQHSPVSETLQERWKNSKIEFCKLKCEIDQIIDIEKWERMGSSPWSHRATDAASNIQLYDSIILMNFHSRSAAFHVLVQ